MVQFDDVQIGFQPLDIFQYPFADDGVLPDQVVLFWCQTLGLLQNQIGDPDLTQVV
jgi:hypothetical protein